MFGSFGFTELLLLLFLFPIFAILLAPYWKTVSKAGYPGAWSLLMLVPFVNLIAMFMFAFSEWPLERAARAAQQRTQP